MSLLNSALSSELIRKYPFFSLVQPIGGVIKSLREIPTSDQTGPGFRRVVADMGNLTGTYSDILDAFGNDLKKVVLGGAGADEHEEFAILRAVGEAAERYASCIVPHNKVVIATAEELGDEGLKFAELLCCSPQEYAHPRCTVRPFDPKAPIRWLKGYSLSARKHRYVPLIMTHLFVRGWETELFWLGISTGVAVHSDLTNAIVTAINEVVERDSLTLAWHLRWPLSRILLDEEPPSELAVKFHRLQRSKIRQYFYDATTDIGVPTVYSLQLTDRHERISQFLSCSSGLSMWQNCGKVIREAATGRSVGPLWGDPPKNFDDFVDIEHGAAYMGHPDRRSDFDFLTQNGRTKPISTFKSNYPSDIPGQFKFLTQRFSELNMDVVLVDLTTDDLRAAGLWAIRAVIPALVPLTFSYRARFLGHPRIYEFAKKIGLDVKSDADINPLPQPFA